MYNYLGDNMSFDGLFLHNLLKELDILSGARIQKINQVGSNEFIFVLHKNKNYKLFLSLDRNYYRLNLTEKEYLNPLNPTMFTMLLRKHFEGGIIKSISQFELDRIVTIEVIKANEFYLNQTKKMIIELMGKNSNLIITDKDNVIVDAFKKIGINESGKTILPHAIYEFESLNKLDIYHDNLSDITIGSYQDIIEKFNGVSPTFAKYLIEKKDLKEYLINFKNLSITPSKYQFQNKNDYYFTPLDNDYIQYDSLSNLVEEFYYSKTIEDIKKNKTNNLETTIKNQIKKLNNKLNKLDIDYQKALSNIEDQKYGNLILQNLYQLEDKKYSNVTLFDYESNQNVTINLDNAKSLKENAKNFFNKAAKGKKALSHIQEQQQITKDEIEYLELISYQISVSSLKDIEQIRDELIANHYLKDTAKKNQKKKNIKIDLTQYEINGYQVYVGKNNMQNDYLTNHLAKSNYYWFHIKDGPGSHVVIFKDSELNEAEIRFCANLAALNSYYKDSSSVPVIYTKIKDLKKIPGKMNCFLEYKNEKAIYIDPKK